MLVLRERIDNGEKDWRCFVEIPVSRQSNDSCAKVLLQASSEQTLETTPSMLKASGVPTEALEEMWLKLFLACLP